MPETLAHLLSSYGYLIVIAALFLENAGLPVPGETTLLAAGFFAQRGILSLPVVIVVAIVACTLGDNLGYWIGRRGGRRLAERHGRKVGLTEARLAAMDRFFERHGAKTVFFARFITGLRVFAGPIAGMSNLPWRRFLFYNATGAIVWVTVIAFVGYLFGESWHLLEAWLGRIGILVAALIGALALVFLFRRYGRLLVRAIERRLPGAITLREVTLLFANLGAVGVFVKIADDVTAGESSHFDHHIREALHAIASPALDLTANLLTAFGNAACVFSLSLVCMVWVWQRRPAIVLTAVIVAYELLNMGLKYFFHRMRPADWDGSVLHGYAFPSGHAMAAMSIYGMMAIILARKHPRARPLIVGLALFLVLGIGLSRVYLGVHWPSDILAGFAAGAFILAAGEYALGQPRAPQP